MGPILKRLKGFCVHRDGILIKLKRSSLFLTGYVSVFRAEFGGVLNSGQLGSQKMSLFAGEWRERNYFGIQISSELVFDLSCDD